MPRLPQRLARSLLLGGVALALGVRPVGAQEDERPIGWDVVFDDEAAEDSSLFFVAMAPGWHITSGPAALLYDPVRTAEGEFRLEAEVFLFPGESDSGFGLMFNLGKLMANIILDIAVFFLRGFVLRANLSFIPFVQAVT